MYSEGQWRVFASPKLDGRGLVKARLVVASRSTPFFISRHSVATRGCTMRVEPAFRADLISAIPHLRAFARSLTYNTIQADDLVQDTLVRAWGKQSQFEPGTNFMAWLFTILRHRYYSVQRKRSREVEDVDEGYARRIACAPDQAIHLDYKDFRAALDRLVPTQREALVLVVAQDFT